MSFLAYYHTSMRWALNNLSAPEFKIYTYLISIAIRPRKSEVVQILDIASWFPIRYFILKYAVAMVDIRSYKPSTLLAERFQNNIELSTIICNGKILRTRS
jgi:hypothetical protein